MHVKHIVYLLWMAINNLCKGYQHTKCHLTLRVLVQKNNQQKTAKHLQLLSTWQNKFKQKKNWGTLTLQYININNKMNIKWIHNEAGLLTHFIVPSCAFLFQSAQPPPYHSQNSRNSSCTFKLTYLFLSVSGYTQFQEREDQNLQAFHKGTEINCEDAVSLWFRSLAPASKLSLIYTVSTSVLFTSSHRLVQSVWLCNRKATLWLCTVVSLISSPYVPMRMTRSLNVPLTIVS